MRCSVVVPVYNGAQIIRRCLDALAAQSMPPDQYEIIVVDDGSKDETPQVLCEWAAQHPAVPLQVVHQENAGPAAARNHGAHVATAPILLFTDADCAPEPDWILAMLSAFADLDVVGAKGAYLTDQTALLPIFVQAEYADRYDRMLDQSQIDFIDTYSAGYRRQVFLDNGGFDPIFTTASVEDQEYSFRLAQKGYKLVFMPEARVRHFHDANLHEYIRRKYFIGFWKALLVRWHPERMVQDSHTPQVLKLQIVLIALLLLLIPATILSSVISVLWWTVPVAIVTAVVFLASTLPFLAKLGRRSWQLAMAGPFLLAVRALSLGSGYLIGTIHFAGTLPGTRQPVIPGWKRFAKRGIDILGALIGLGISIPFVAVAAVAIKLDTPGPIFYRQLRVGENGKRFEIIKLRSMVANAEQQLDNLLDMQMLPEPAFKIVDDPRVTRVGRLLRRTSLDEAPQFFNVLRGDMSLVGPRPEEVRIVAMYDDYQRRRLAVKPGMTGPMQINGRGSLTLADRLRLEIDYIDNYSLRRDVAIMLQTIPAIVRGQGAY